MPEQCTDGRDNDNDGLVDCQDSDCFEICCSNGTKNVFESDVDCG